MRDLMGMMKQAQAMQQKMQALQAELEPARGRGPSGGGMVKVDAHRQGRAEERRDRSLASQARRGEILEDLSSPRMPTPPEGRARRLQEKMQAVTGGLPLPPGLKLF